MEQVDQEYRAGLEKLGLWPHQAGGWNLQSDLRKDRAFAWRVLEMRRFIVDPQRMRAHGWHVTIVGTALHFWYENLGDALYAAVCALGREP
jgi:hypothetical protein